MTAAARRSSERLHEGSFFQRRNLLGGQAGQLLNFGRRVSLSEHLPGNLGRVMSDALLTPLFTALLQALLQALLNSQLDAFFPGEGDLVPYVSFCIHVVLVFDFFCRSKIRQIRRTKQEAYKLEKGRAALSPVSQRNGRRLPLSGTNPDRNYIRLPTAPVVGPDFHFLAVLRPGIGRDADKRRHSHFNLKFRASG